MVVSSRKSRYGACPEAGWLSWTAVLTSMPKSKEHGLSVEWSRTVYRSSGLARSMSSSRAVSASAGRGPWFVDSSTDSAGQPWRMSQFCACGMTGWRSCAKSNVRWTVSRVMCSVTYSAVPGMSQMAARSYSSR